LPRSGSQGISGARTQSRPLGSSCPYLMVEASERLVQPFHASGAKAAQPVQSFRHSLVCAEMKRHDRCGSFSTDPAGFGCRLTSAWPQKRTTSIASTATYRPVRGIAASAPTALERGEVVQRSWPGQPSSRWQQKDRRPPRYWEAVYQVDRPRLIRPRGQACRAMGLVRFTTCAPMPVRRSSTPHRALETYMRGCRSE
jgi:hypothetical protein